MILPPLPFMYAGAGMFQAVGRHAQAVLEEQCGQGEVRRLVEQEERSEVSHDHEFAWLGEAFKTLPDHLSGLYRSKEHLRKAALIATGWCHVRDYPTPSRKEADRLAAALTAELDEYVVIQVEDAVVRVCRAKSQARNKMKAADFQASKAAILEWVAALLEVEPEVLRSQGGAGANNPRAEAA